MQSSRLVPDNNNTTIKTMDKRVGAQVARGDCMGGRSDLPFLPCCYYAKNRFCLGLVAVVSNQRFRLKRE
jgi:hypothetical protein